MPSGILIVDKPQGWTSMDVCAKLRGVLGERRIGHGGTLDPMATGVLPVFVGRATRGVEYAVNGDKEYLAGLRLGVTTDTQDITGTVLERHPVSGVRERLDEVLNGFRGHIAQLPPMYSAIKVGGRKLYELARKGKEIKRVPRQVHIHSLQVEGCPAPDLILLRVACSKGTYVRTLCHDIGQRLGCGGCLDSLRRTMAAGFSEGEALTMEQILEAEQPVSLLSPIDRCFAHLPALTMTAAQSRCVRNGRAFTWQGEPGQYRVYDPEGEFLALAMVEGETLRTVKSFFAV